jgi:HD superfamily phosphohydrolase
VLNVNPLELKRLFFSPLVVRLHYVAQLSTTYLRANIDARHCRLSHALGTLCILSDLLQVLVTKIASEEALNQCLPTREEVISAFTYAALHDAYQGPFGHALDALREDLVEGMHSSRRLDKTLLNTLVGAALNFKLGEPDAFKGPLAIQRLTETLDQTVAGPMQIDLERLLSWIFEASRADPADLSDPKKSLRHRQIRWLHELLEGPLDADRWDYLWRDTLHLGFTRDHDTLSDLMRDFAKDVAVHWDGVQSHLVVPRGLGDRLGRDFFALRKNLYRNVYENPEKRVIDGILLRCVNLGLLHHLTRHREGIDLQYWDFVVNLVHLTDADLLGILEKIDHPLLAHLARDIRTYPAIRVFWTGDMGGEEVASASQVYAEVLEHFEYKGRNPPLWTERRHAGASDEQRLEYTLAAVTEALHPPPIRRRSLQEIGPSNLPSLLLHCSILPKRPARVLQFERLVWKLVVHQLAATSIIAKVAESFRVALAGWGRRETVETLQSLMNECPPLFVSFPWIADFSKAAMQEMAREPISGSAIYIRDENGRDDLVDVASLMSSNSESEAYVAVAGYPLTAIERLAEHELELFEAAASLAIDSLLSRGCCLAVPRDLLSPENDRVIIRYMTDEPVQV